MSNHESWTLILLQLKAGPEPASSASGQIRSWFQLAGFGCPPPFALRATEYRKGAEVLFGENSSFLGSRKQINTHRLRRIFVRLQGAPRGAYYLYVTFGATLKAGKKTSKIADLFVSEALILRFIILSIIILTAEPCFIIQILSFENISNFLTLAAPPY